jgi:RNA polymerase sigma-70 factor (ECF subfamily)
VEKSAFMRACREGGPAIEEALRSLDRSFYALLHRDCVRSVRDAETARDLVQETFIKVWLRCATFHGESELLPWIRSILRHAILDRLRKPEREVPMGDEEDRSPAIERGMAALQTARAGAPDDELRRRETGACFQKCWKRFEAAAPAHAAVLSWIVEDGLSNEEVSELLGRTPGATREFLSQCRKRARLHLAEWYQLAFGVGGPA